MSIEEARDALERTCDDALGGLGIQLARRINDLIDAKLSPAPVGEERRKFVGDIIAGIKPEVDRLMGKAPTPPAKDTEGEDKVQAALDRLYSGETHYPHADVTFVRNRIADLEARLAEAGTKTLEWAGRAGHAERALADATKRIEALEAGLRPFAEAAGEMALPTPALLRARALLSPASEGKTDG